MQKIFKIERVSDSSEFKHSKQALRNRKRKARMNRKSRQNIDLEKMIAAQTKLHNEEKELLFKQEQIFISSQQNLQKSDELDETQLLKSDSVLSVEQETKATATPAEDEIEKEGEHSKIYITSIDAAILEGLDFIEHAPQIREVQQNFRSQMPTLLPEKEEAAPEYTLVLDLDETLVHCSIAPFEGYDEVRENIYISYRPYLVDFLDKVSKLFEVVVFTASEKEYACMVLDRIDPEHKYIKHRLYRNSCLPLNGNYIKDLSVLGRDLNKTLIIDNSVIAFSLNIDNGILIHSFSGNKRDCELHKLVQVLEYAISMNIEPNQFDIREYLTSIFQLKERISYWQSKYMAHLQQQQQNVQVSSS